MKDRDENNLSMKLTVKEVLTENESLWNTIPKFAEAVLVFFGMLVKLVAERQIQEKHLKGVTENKAAKKAAMCELAVEIGSIVMAYANSINDLVLRDLVNYSYSRLSRDRDTRSRDRCLLIYNKALPLAIQLKDFGLKDTKLAELNTAIESYVEILTAPRAATGERKTSGINIDKLIKDSDDTLKNSIDNMMVPFKTSNPDFYNKYTSARMIIDLGLRHNKPLSTITGKSINFETEENIVNSKIYLEGDEKNAVKSDEKGAFKIGVYKEGENVLIAEKEGYQKCEEMVFITKGEDLELNLELEKEEIILPGEE